MMTRNAVIACLLMAMAQTPVTLTRDDSAVIAAALHGDDARLVPLLILDTLADAGEHAFTGLALAREVRVTSAPERANDANASSAIRLIRPVISGDRAAFAYHVLMHVRGEVFEDGHDVALKRVGDVWHVEKETVRG